MVEVPAEARLAGALVSCRSHTASFTWSDGRMEGRERALLLAGW